MQYLLGKVTQTYTWLSDYYYGHQQQTEDYSKLSKNDKIMALRKVLISKCCFSQQINGKIEMQFTKLLQAKNYQNFTFSTKLPLQYPTFPNNSSTTTISFIGQFVLKTDKIKCPLSITCLFQNSFPTTSPKIYVNYPVLTSKNSNGEIFQIPSIPNPQFVSIIQKKRNPQNIGKHWYKARTGGIEVILHKQGEKVALKQLIDEALEKMKLKFPFLKSKKAPRNLNEETNQDEITQKIYSSSRSLKECLSRTIKSEQSEKEEEGQSQKAMEILKRGQQMDILLKSINNEINYQKQQNLRILNILKTIKAEQQKVQKTKNLSEYYPRIDQSQLFSREIYELLVEYQTTKDCLIQIQAIIKSPIQVNQKLFSNEELKQNMEIWQSFNDKLYWQRLQIKKLMVFLKNDKQIS